MCTINEESFFVILGHFLLFNPPKSLKYQSFEKVKKTPGAIIISYKGTINDNNMMYDSWDMKCDRQNFVSLCAIFCHFTSLTMQTIKILKEWKKYLEISSFYTSVPKIMIICYNVPEIWSATDVIVIFHVGLFFTHLPP